MRWPYTIVFLCLLLFAAVIYSSSFFLPYYADDFQYVFTEPSRFLFHDYFTQNPINTFYRPIQTTILSAIQTMWRWETLPIRILHLFVHSLIALLIFRSLRFWQVSVPVAFFGACYFILAQMTGAAVLGNDTISQLLATLFFVATLWQFYRYKRDANRANYLWSIVLYFLAILSKETSSGLIVALGLLSLVMNSSPRKIGRVLMELAPYVVCIVVYWFMRTTAGAEVPAFGTDEQYRFSFQINVPINLGLLVIQSFAPISSLSIAKWSYEDNYLLLAGTGFIMIAVAAIVVNGLLRSPHRHLILAICSIIFLSWIPVMFLSRVSEQYVYNSAPFVAALFAIALQYYWKRPSSVKLVVPFVLLISALNVHGLIDKSQAMKEQGIHAKALFDQVVTLAKDAPPNANVYLIQPRESRFYYSLYRIRGFTVMSWSEHLLQQATGRPDLHLFIYEPHDYAELVRDPKILLTYDPVTLRVHPFQGTSHAASGD